MSDTEVKPLTPEEQKTRDDLNARAAAVAYAEAEKTRKERLEALASVDALIKLVRTDKITAAMDAVIADAGLDFETKNRVVNMRQSMDYNISQLLNLIESAKAPTQGTVA